jgi:hypothetical protein
MGNTSPAEVWRLRAELVAPAVKVQSRTQSEADRD